MLLIITAATRRKTFRLPPEGENSAVFASHTPPPFAHTGQAAEGSVVDAVFRGERVLPLCSTTRHVDLDGGG